MKFIALPATLLATSLSLAEDLPDSLKFEQHEINAISVVVDGHQLAINRSTGAEPELLLLTHGRRDVVEFARDSSPQAVHAPSASREFLEGTSDHWNAWWENRFDYYEQQVTRLPVNDFPTDQYLEDGESFTWRGHEFQFLATPGYTRDGGSYITVLDGRKVVFTGELILDGGRVQDLYSFQESIPEAKIGGYHGYMGRLAIWLESLDKLAAEKPDLLIPSRGPIIQQPLESISAAHTAARQIYSNYLSTNALHWYFGEDRMNTCAERVLGPGESVSGMPLAEHIDLPDWCQHMGTTKLLVSKSGRGFVLDVGGTRSLDTLKTAIADGLVKGIDGIFATHTHNDHTAAIAEAAREFGCPVYAIPEVADVIANPGNSFLPGVSPNAVDEVITRKDGEKMAWQEFTLTFRFYPGQMYNHGALLVEHEEHDPVFFIGDSFSPSGIDDYCLMNRNLMGTDTGYELCFQILDSLPGNTWLVNQHIPHLFRFTAEEKSFLLERYQKRRKLISQFVNWDHVDYAVDSQWASFYPYGQTVTGSQPTSTDVVIHNHSTEPRSFTVGLSGDFTSASKEKSIEIAPRESGVLIFPLDVADSARPGVHVITATITRDDGVISRDFCESLIRIE